MPSPLQLLILALAAPGATCAGVASEPTRGAHAAELGALDALDARPLEARQSEAAAAAPEHPLAELEGLRSRELYAQLEREQVEALAQAAARRWPRCFEGLGPARVERFEAGGASHWVSIWPHAASSLEFVLIPGGRIPSASTDNTDNTENSDDSENSESPGSSDEPAADRAPAPAGQLRLDPFLICRSECTKRAWARFAEAAQLDSQPAHFSGSFRMPVESVSALEAQRWCQAAGFALPTAAQWEFACRAGTSGDFAYGSELTPEQARFAHTREEGPLKVGSCLPNAFGLFDMHGNVWEWCRDPFLAPGAALRAGSGLQEGESSSRALRGGCFTNPARETRLGYRYGLPALEKSRYIGFRPSLDLAP